MRGAADGTSDRRHIGLGSPSPPADRVVGRSEELALLHAELERVRAGAPRVVVMEGGAGVGKTALAWHWLSAAQDLRVLHAVADEDESRLPYGVVGQLVAGLPVVPEALVGTGTPGGPVPDPFAVGATLLQTVGSLQDPGGLAIVVDDAQWMDGPSVQALTFLLRRLHADRVLAVLVAREEPPGLAEGLHRLATPERGLRLRLGGLDVEGMQELAEGVTHARLSRRAAQRLRDHTDGNPLHAMALLQETGLAALEATEAPWPAPRSFAFLVLARLAGCSEAAVRLVEAAAVLGRSCPLRLAGEVGEVDDPPAALEEASCAAVLDMDSATPPSVAFSHPLVRAAVYHNLGPARRSALHLRAAARADGAAALRHRVAAAMGEDPVLADELEAHARHECSRGALAPAAGYLLTAAGLSPERSERERLLLDGVALLLRAGEASEAASRAEQVASCSDSPRRSYVLGHLALLEGRLDDAEALLTGAWESGRATADSGLAGLVCLLLAQVCMGRARHDDAVRWATLAMGAGDDPEDGGPALGVLIPCLGLAGRGGDGLALVAPLRRGAPERTPAELEALLARGMVRMWIDDLCGAREDLGAVAETARDQPSQAGVLALALLADADYRVGAWDDSVVHAELGVSLALDSGRLMLGPVTHSMTIWVPAARGQWATAESHLAAAGAAVAVTGDLGSQVCVSTVTAHLAFCRGDPAGVVRAIDPAHLERWADEPGVHPWRELRAEALVDLGLLSEAEAALSSLEGLAEARGRRSALARAARVRAKLEAARARTDRARAAFEAALAYAGELPSPFEQALTDDAYGRFLRRAGDRRAAAGRLEAALDAFTRLGANPFAERCDVELAACGLSPRQRRTPPRFRLTPQELAVARLVAEGRSNREVAAALVVSVKTVEAHLSRAYVKLGVRSRSQLAACLDCLDD